MSKTQPKQKAKNSLRPPIGLQQSEKIYNPEAGFSFTKRCTGLDKIDLELNLKHMNEPKLKKTYLVTNIPKRLLTLYRSKNATK